MNNYTPGPWEICEFSETHADALPGEVAVFAPKHPDSFVKEDGTWNGVTICRGMTGPAKRENATLIAATPDLLFACEVALTVIDSDSAPSAYALVKAAIAKATGGQSE